MSEHIPYQALVKVHSNSFTKAEKKIATFIEHNRHKVIISSISKLSNQIGVGEASLIRFCRKLGFSGIPEFKDHLSKDLSDSDVNEISIYPSLETTTNSFKEIATILHSFTQEALNETLKLQTESALDDAATMISRSNGLYFYGIGMSGVSALEAKYRFLRLGFRTDALTDNHTLILHSSNTRKGDVIIAFSHSGDSTDVERAIRVAKSNGADIILISKFKKTPLSQLADINLLTGGSENPFESDSSSIKSSQSYIIDVLYSSVVFINKGRSTRRVMDSLRLISDDSLKD